jgi:hypothetical protein
MPSWCAQGQLYLGKISTAVSSGDRMMIITIHEFSCRANRLLYYMMDDSVPGGNYANRMVSLILCNFYVLL